MRSFSQRSALAVAIAASLLSWSNSEQLKYGGDIHNMSSRYRDRQLFLPHSNHLRLNESDTSPSHLQASSPLVDTRQQSMGPQCWHWRPYFRRLSSRMSTKFLPVDPNVVKIILDFLNEIMHSTTLPSTLVLVPENTQRSTLRTARDRCEAFLDWRSSAMDRACLTLLTLLLIEYKQFK